MFFCALAFICFYLLTGARENEVSAASFSTQGNARESLNSCKSVCNDNICQNEADRLKTMMNESIDPCEDFFAFTCGTFWKTHGFINYYGRWSIFEDHQRIIDNEVLTALKEFNSTRPKSIVMMKNYYESCMKEDEDMNTILKILKNIGFPALLGDNWDESAYDWKEAVYEIIDEGIQISFPVVITTYDQRLMNNVINVPKVLSAETYIKRDLDADQIPKYRSFIIDSLLALGANEFVAKRDTEQLIKFESDLNNITTETPPSKLEADTVEFWSKRYPNIPWLELFSRMYKRHDMAMNSPNLVLMTDEGYLANFEVLIKQTPKRTVANYIAWNLLRKVYPYLPKQFGDVAQKHYEQTTNREVFCFNELKNSFSIALDALYVRKRVQRTEEIKDVETIVQNIKNQIEMSMEQADWLDNATRSLLSKKIREMRTLIGYSEELLENDKIDKYYSKVELTTKSFLESYFALSDFNYGNDIKSWHGIPEKITWTNRPIVVALNPVHKYFYNTIVSSESLRNFWYTYGRPNYLNYGALGSLIGHEMYHGFDDRGRFMDENGFHNNWWTDNANQKYNERAQCLINQYNDITYPSLNNLRLNGAKTLNENIADHGGFKAAYYAYTRWVEKNGITEKCLPGFKYTPKQWFWISSAMNWCDLEGDGWIEIAINKDTHPPHYPRVHLSYSNFKEFAEDFKCRPGSRMNPKTKCQLW